MRSPMRPFGGVDVDLEPVVDDHEDQEQEADRDQIGFAPELESVEEQPPLPPPRKPGSPNSRCMKVVILLGMAGQLLDAR